MVKRLAPENKSISLSTEKQAQWAQQIVARFEAWKPSIFDSRESQMGLSENRVYSQ